MSATPILVPRVNANDDVVGVVDLPVSVGDAVTAGTTIAEVETEKTVVEVACPHDGVLLRLDAKVGERLTVGQVLAWIGATGDEAIEETAASSFGIDDQRTSPTLGAAALMRRYGIAESDIKAQGRRVSAEDVRRHIGARGLAPTPQPAVRPDADPARALPAPSVVKPMSSFQRGMARTVEWHRVVPAPAYLEVPFDHAGWRSYADDWAKSSSALFDPLLALIAHRFVQIAREIPELNATVSSDGVHYYEPVNMGFSVRTPAGLAMVVVKDAQDMDETAFVKALSRLQRNALANRLTGEQTSGATLAFSSLAGERVSRHIPILPPNTSVILAHSAPGADGEGALGAGYDHRLLDGATVARALGAIRPRCE